jgi:hypothetical protein
MFFIMRTTTDSGPALPSDAPTSKQVAAFRSGEMTGKGVLLIY